MSDTAEYKVDKARFKNRGPWDSEPDKLNWKDEETGLACMIVRNSMGALCGYVAVTRDHPYFGQDYNKFDVECHGGLTYANKCSGHICHIPEPGEPDDVWWFGFDCGHCGDFIPSYSDRGDGYYCTIKYVRGQVKSLARQLHEASQ